MLVADSTAAGIDPPRRRRRDLPRAGDRRRPARDRRRAPARPGQGQARDRPGDRHARLAGLAAVRGRRSPTSWSRSTAAPARSCVRATSSATPPGPPRSTTRTRSSSRAATPGLRDRKDKDSPLLTSLRLTLQLPRITSGKGCLSGTYVDARIGEKGQEGLRQGARLHRRHALEQPLRGADGLLPHRPHPRLRRRLGLSKPLRRKPQKVLADAITDDNSFYSSPDARAGARHRRRRRRRGRRRDRPRVRPLAPGPGVARLAAEARGGDDGRGLRRLRRRDDVGPDHRREPVRHLHLRLGRDRLLAHGHLRPARRTAPTTSRRPSASAGRRSTASARSGRRRCSTSGSRWATTRRAARSWTGSRSSPTSCSRGSRTSSDGARALIAADNLLYAGAHAAAIEAAMVQKRFCKRVRLLTARRRERAASSGRFRQKIWPAGVREGDPRRADWLRLRTGQLDARRGTVGGSLAGRCLVQCATYGGRCKGALKNRRRAPEPALRAAAGR